MVGAIVGGFGWGVEWERRRADRLALLVEEMRERFYNQEER